MLVFFGGSDRKLVQSAPDMATELVFPELEKSAGLADPEY